MLDFDNLRIGLQTKNIEWYIKKQRVISMKVSIEQIEYLEEERVSIYCHDDQSDWVKNVKEAALGQVVVCGYKANVMYRLNLLDVFYFEVVDGNSFIYTRMCIR